MKTNWELIKTAYVTSDKDMKEIADAFKVNFDVLRRHAAKERWTEQRKLFRVTTTKQATEKRSSEMATDIAQFDSDSLKLARAGYQLVAEDMKSRKPTRDIATALANFQKVGKLAFGESTDKPETTGVINILVASEKSKQLTGAITAGKGTD